ncbi:MAG: type II secretion system F family protein [Acidimicrobiales bacterium]
MTAVVVGSWAVVVGTWAWGWVRPLPLTMTTARHRTLVVGLTAEGSVGPGVPTWFAARVERADLPGAVERWWLAAVGATASAVLVGWTLGGPVLSMVATVGTGGAGMAALHSLRTRRDDNLVRSVPDALDAVARSSRAGSSVVQALCALDGPDAGPAEMVLARAGARVGRGVSLRQSLDAVVDQHPLPAMRLAVASLLVGAETGAAPARAVDGVAATLRDRAALEREAAAQATQARASAAVLVLAPVGFAVVAVGADPKVGDFLFRSPVGWACLTLGAGFDALGAWWMHRIVRSAR